MRIRFRTKMSRIRNTDTRIVTNHSLIFSLLFYSGWSRACTCSTARASLRGCPSKQPALSAVLLSQLSCVPPSFVIFWWRFLCHWPVYCSVLLTVRFLRGYTFFVVPYVLHSCPWLLHDSHACLSLSLMAVTSQLKINGHAK